MKISRDKKLKEIKIFKPGSFKDFRGEIWTNWEKKYLKNVNFNLSKFTKSKKNVLRGFHGDKKSWKLISCIKGEILNVVVDYRKNSKTYLKHTFFYLNDKNRTPIERAGDLFQIAIPLSGVGYTYYSDLGGLSKADLGFLYLGYRF